MMFAVVPVVIVVSVVCASAIGVFLAWKWLASDKHKDIVVFMGPKAQGKSEFMSALLREPFNPDREGTSPRIKLKKCAVEGKNLGKHKKVVVFDSDGARNNIKSYVKGLVNYINRVSPEYALVVLVINREFLSQEVMDAADELGEYLDFWVARCCKKVKAKDIKMGYALALTCCKEATENEGRWLQEVSKELENYKGSVRRMDDKKSACFELSEEESRRGAITWVTKTLKRLHEE